ALVDGLLELDGPAPPLGIVAGQLGEPLRAHANVGDLVGEHEVHRALHDRIADLPGDVDELIEHVAGQPFQPTAHAGLLRGGVLGAGASPQDGRLGKFSDVAPEVLEQAQVDLDVARLVPDLARHVHGELPGSLGKVVHGAASAFHGL